MKGRDQNRRRSIRAHDSQSFHHLLMAAAANFVSSNKQKQMRVHQGHIFQFDKLSADGGKKYWRCEKRKECHARMHTDSETDEVLQRVGVHTHAPDQARIEVKNAIGTMKDRAVSTQDSTKQICTLCNIFSSLINSR